MVACIRLARTEHLHVLWLLVRRFDPVGPLVRPGQYSLWGRLLGYQSVLLVTLRVVFGIAPSCGFLCGFISVFLRVSLWVL